MDIFATFRAAADPVKAAQMSAYMRDQFKFLGIPTPQRKQLSREFLKGLSKNKTAADWAFISRCWEQPEREIQYLAVDYLVKLKPKLSPADVPRIKKLLTTKSWWDTVDALDMVVGDIALRNPEVDQTLLTWSQDNDLWLRRTAIDHQLMRKNQTNTQLLKQILINNFGQTEFFINKAIGWSLRDYSKTNPDWVRNFIKRHKEEMSPLSIKEASKYL